MPRGHHGNNERRTRKGSRRTDRKIKSQHRSSPTVPQRLQISHNRTNAQGRYHLQLRRMGRSESIEQAALATYGSLQALLPGLSFIDKDTFFNTVKREGLTLSKATDATIRQLSKDYGQDPDAQPKWPTIDLEVAQLDDLPAAYAQQIRDNLKTYLQQTQGTQTAALIGEAAVGYHHAIIGATSDDGLAQVANTAIAGAAKDMAYSSLLFPAGTTQHTIGALADWIEKYERDTRQQPTTNEIRVKGIELGIKWTSQYPQQTPINVQEVFPGWQAAQDQLGKIFTPGNE